MSCSLLILFLQLSFIYLSSQSSLPPPPSSSAPPPPPPPPPQNCFLTQTCPTENFKLIGPTDGRKFLTVLFWTRQNNFASVCPSLVSEISDPCSEKYGNYYTLDQIKAKTYSASDLQIITKYFLQVGVTGCNITTSPNGDYVVINATVATIQRILSNKYYDYKSLKTGLTFSASLNYTLPSSLNGVVTYPMGHGGSSSPTPPPPPQYSTPTPAPTTPVPGVLSRKRSLEAFDYATPQVIRAHYNNPKNLQYTPENARQCILGACGQSFSPVDLRSWQNSYNFPPTQVFNVTGLNDPSTCSHELCYEGNLDMQYIYTFTPKGSTWFWSVENNPFVSPFLNFAAQINADPNPPDVISISYANAEKLVDPREVAQFNTEACKMALRGLTVIVASGDYGAPGLEGCLGPTNATLCTINPLYPAACPYVTAVGATMGPEEGKPEVAATYPESTITSGGGFSSIFTRPVWQNNAVKRYLNNFNNVDTSKFFNKNRAYPDVSFMGNNFPVYDGGRFTLMSGTSASAPAFASLIALANAIRASNDKPKLGFLNPLLYNRLLEGAFNDITEGTNDCCSNYENKCCPGIGWTASTGWDPVTGLGTLDSGKFLSIVGDYPHRVQSTEGSN